VFVPLLVKVPIIYFTLISTRKFVFGSYVFRTGGLHNTVSIFVICLNLIGKLP